MNRTLNTVAVVLVLLLFLSASVASAQLKPVTESVQVSYDYDSGTGCVTRIKVKSSDGSKDVTFDSILHLFRPASIVEWKLIHPSPPATDTEWSLKEESSTYAVCNSSYKFVDNKAACDAKDDFFGTADWVYTVLATKTGCDPATVDPQVIFRKGKGSVILLLAVVVLTVGLGLLVVRARKRART